MITAAVWLCVGYAVRWWTERRARQAAEHRRAAFQVLPGGATRPRRSGGWLIATEETATRTVEVQ